jgi:hypothetical protein
MNEDGEKYGDKVEALMVKYFATFDSCSWPEPGGEGWEDIVRIWVSAFGEHRYSPPRIKRAMDKIHQSPPQWKQDHLPALLKLLAGDGSAGPTDPLPQLEDCPQCGGNGWATVYRDDYRGEESVVVNDPINNKSRRVYLRITAPCVCKLGRRAYASCMAKGVKTVDLEALPRGWSADEPDWVPAGERGRA